jgi:hypothetical protein
MGLFSRIRSWLFPRPDQDPVLTPKGYFKLPVETPPVRPPADSEPPYCHHQRDSRYGSGPGQMERRTHRATRDLPGMPEIPPGREVVDGQEARASVAAREAWTRRNEARREASTTSSCVHTTVWPSQFDSGYGVSPQGSGCSDSSSYSDSASSSSDSGSCGGSSD